MRTCIVILSIFFLLGCKEDTRGKDLNDCYNKFKGIGHYTIYHVFEPNEIICISDNRRLN